MKVIFGTTNERKVEDLSNLSKSLGLDLDILSLGDIGWNLGEIEESGKTLEENSLIKANAIYCFCKENDINYPIITDDAGLFVDALDGEPGIYTGRYADEEIKKDPTLPKYQCVFKLLNKLEDVSDRSAKYVCVVTCMLPDGTYFQESAESKGVISKAVMGDIKKPYFYSIFILSGLNKIFSELKDDELKDTYRYNALKKVLKKIK